MSRLAQPKSSPTAKRDSTARDGQDEICPVCKSSRYLNASLRFLVNPVCYHKMCESCVDRLFSHGPAACPIPGCGRTLRKNNFRKQTFEDIHVEREVDIRRRVAAIFNRREDEFETLMDYNNYLNDVEDITFNLINGIDVEETEARLDEYKKMHQQEITDNATLAQQESMSYSKLQKAERENARQRRETARREEADEKREMETSKRDAIRRLANGENPDQVASEGGGVTLKKRLNRQDAAARQQQLQAADSRNGSSNLVIKGLKAKVKAEPEAPIDPFGGLSFVGRKYYSLQDTYVWDVLRNTEQDRVVVSGGYSVLAFTQRALCEAFSGLGCFIAEESTEREKVKHASATAGAQKLEVAAADVKMEDPF